MNIIEELVHYCKNSDPIGALLLSGGWGSGKTYLIEHDLSDALGSDYVIVRISLFGVNNVSALHDAITRKWLSSCYPLMSRIALRKEKADEYKGIQRFINSFVKKANPIVADAADAISSVNIMNMVNVRPIFEDMKTHKKRKAILVFDDMERSNINMTELLGVINDYCENQNFNTIIVANLRYLMLNLKGDLNVFKTLKEKTITHTVLYQPDYKSIIHKIITDKDWRDEDYKNFLLNNETLIIDTFESSKNETENKEGYEKTHNLLTLISTLQSFYRIYHHLIVAGYEDISSMLGSFIPYMICHNNGIIRNDQLVFECSDEDIHLLYPQYCKDRVFPSIRNWIATGGFEKEKFYSELKNYLATAS